MGSGPLPGIALNMKRVYKGSGDLGEQLHLHETRWKRKVTSTYFFDTHLKQWLQTGSETQTFNLYHVNYSVVSCLLAMNIIPERLEQVGILRF